MIMKKILPKHIRKAMQWYDDEIYNPDRDRLSASYGFSSSRAVNSRTFEIWAAILLKLEKEPNTREDLPGWEIKSARGDSLTMVRSKNGLKLCKQSTSLRYEYYPRGGLDKLKNEYDLQHMYIVYKDNYASVDVWVLSGQDLMPVFKTWKTDMTKLFRSDRHNRRDVMRALAYGYVQAHGQQVMQIRKGKLIFCDEMFSGKGKVFGNRLLR